MKVVSVALSRGLTATEVFDLTVEPHHLYVAGPAGAVVSNSKRISMLDVNALLSHGAVATLRDAGAVRGQKNEDYWLQFLSGHAPRDPKVPKVYEKFVAQLQASGINVVRGGDRLHVMALTGKDVDRLAGDREITSGDTVHFDKGLAPVPGGLFDPRLTGGHGGTRWSAIRLHEPLPNPAMEEPVRRVLGLTQKEFDAAVAGDHPVGKYGSGPAAIAKALGDLDLDKEIAAARAAIKGGRKGARDMAVRRLGFLLGAQQAGLHPGDWVIDRAPVLPPAFRPVSVMGGPDGSPLVADANYLYKELLEATSNLKAMSKEVGDDNVGPERAAAYQALKAVVGLGDPVGARSREKGVKGILKTVFGSAPKHGVVQRKLLSSTVDNVGRAVIVPNPDYDMDTVGLPEGRAFDVYGRFIASRLRRAGLPLGEALRHVREKSGLARDALLKEMAQRPVFINRAPVLHKFGIMAFRPRLVKGDTLNVSPLVVKGFNADFDGDAMQFHVPATDDAVREAYDRLLPSKNLLSPADFKTPVHVAGQEYQGGIHRASTAKKDGGRVRHFRRQEDVEAAYRRGDLDDDDEVVVLEG